MEQNKNDMFEDMRAAGSTLPDIVEALKKRGWRNYNHHDNWIHPNVIGEFTTHQAYDYDGWIGLGIAGAVEKLCETLVDDKEYWDTWVANIAISVYDELQFNFLHDESTMAHCVMDRSTALEKCNKGAQRFLRLLTSEKKTTEDGKTKEEK